ncbi:putative RiPP precursor [Mesorhizobium opportunistum]|nr:putative RiPP precursor [Mesorhizobium opportunistum]UQS65548.1 putative RiPP precursor [Mesorhizobium opportunistum]
MKKIYEKPSLSKREKLSAVTAIACPISQPCG